MNINKIIADELNIRLTQVDAAVKLIDEGNTIPFISRYRKEATGALNDEQLRNLFDRLTYLRNLEDKKATVLTSIADQGLLTDELKAQIEAAMTMVVLEDLYRPYRPKRRTRATIAKEKGLEGLANIIMLQMTKKPLEAEAQAYINPEKEVNTVEEAIAGACDILAESISDEADYRIYIRKHTFDNGFIVSKAKDESSESVYEMYYDYTEAVKKLPGHRVLAINRGEAEKFLSVKISLDKEPVLRYLEKQIIVNDNVNTAPTLKLVIEDAFDRLIFPSIEREIRNELTEKAEDSAISVFGKNLEQLLLQPPVAGHTVLGWDPAFRTGCKLAVVDPTGKVLDTKVIYPTAPQNKVDEAKRDVKALIKKYGITLISVGNGTASRESEVIIAGMLKELDTHVEYVIVNEAGASVYSASKLATEEFPNFDVGQRSAASIARRIQDPLAELVKIDPKSIGVGQYQHDMNQKKLSDALTGVVEDSVNKVGVDLNTASAALLEYISGINKTLAKNIVDYREQNGRFTNRKQLLKVPKLGPKAFEQCAGFMRITGGDNPLDATSVHPESYEATIKLLESLGLGAEDIKTGIKIGGIISGSGSVSGSGKSVNNGGSNKTNNVNGGLGKADTNTVSGNISSDKLKKLAAELGVGEMTLADIIKELEKPGRDPREDSPKPVLRSDVLSMEDLTEGMILKGTVRNVIDFGAFVDIGVHQDGLVHISQICDRYIKHPLEAVSVGDIVEVKVLGVDINKKRISLTMRNI